MTNKRRGKRKIGSNVKGKSRSPARMTERKARATATADYLRE
jgi:hypothetical protein